MLEWLASEKVRSVFIHLASDGIISAMLFVVFFSLSVFFLFSRRMNARAEPVVASPPFLPQLAQSLLKGDEPARSKRLVAQGLLITHWLFYIKLKLPTRVRTEQKLSVWLLLLASLLGARSPSWVLSSETFTTFRDANNTIGDQAGQLRSALILALYIIVYLVPFLLVKKNRELYFDIIVLFFLFDSAAMKLLNCWGYGCCFGIPSSWGVYDEALGTTLFPVQLLEFVVGASLFVLCVIYMLFAKTYRPGRGSSMCMFAYMIPRFFWEYLRYESEPYVSVGANGKFGLSVVQIVCLCGIAVGVIWLFVLPLEKKLMDRLWLFASRFRKPEAEGGQ